MKKRRDYFVLAQILTDFHVKQCQILSDNPLLAFQQSNSSGDVKDKTTNKPESAGENKQYGL